MAALKKTKRTQAERVEASDNAMLTAAIKLIARDGPSKMTLARLGQEAGVSPGLVNHRFGSKEKLLEATALRALDAWSNQLSAFAKMNPEGGLETLELIGKLYIDTIAKRSDIMLAQSRLMTESYSSHPELLPTFQKYNRQIREQIVDILRPAQESRAIRKDLDLETFAIVFIGALRGISTQYLIDDKSVDFNAAYNLLSNICRQAL